MDVSKTTTLKHFNSQPHEEADNQDFADGGKRLYFNSQPHEEADDLTVYPINDQHVIH